ncbi:hypothetical protein BDZ97DRAFT_2071094 [Flammula alnicola]|nr:hypothetical protein BDZ97DRAFT_2071094 [Flammula alnicola]
MPHKREDFESLTLLDDPECDDPIDHSRERGTQPNSLSLAMTIGLLVFFLLDIFAFIWVARLLLNAKLSIEDIDNIEFRNPYIGLDELYGYHKVKPSHYNKLINEPRLAAQISPAEPNKVFPIDAHRWLSDFGVLSPPDRHLQVSSKNEIHTIVQFNVLDYGMEKCALAVRLPNREDILPHPYSLPNSGDVVPLEICELNVKRPLKERSISWSRRPDCVRQLGIVEAKIGGEVEMVPFPCKSGSFIGYQISCATYSPGCNIDVWTNHNATWGVFINQYQTVL